MENKSNQDSFLDISVNTPWKLTAELCMYLIKPFVLIYMFLKGVKVSKGAKFYGFPKVFKHRHSRIEIGSNFEARSWRFSNPIGIHHPLIICTWSKDAKIVIGDDVGVSGGSIVASRQINIGNRVLIGANSTIMDTNFHPLKGNKRYSKENIASDAVIIDDDVFIGMNAIVLKGNHIKSNSIIPAGRVVRNG